ncbi:sigma-70 family RNA polymerase sigma factor [Silvibacterium sp.]|uniref:sigma-70 family RNA polymerase sigma factor n=1 Tax=Silvibacterium sp. TaxID=1964179 RepID=UPI0039E4BAB7
MFEFEKLIEGAGTARVTLTQRQAQRAEDRRRDIFDSHRHRIFALSYYMTGNEIAAENLLGETFIAAFRKKAEPEAQDVDAALVGHLQTMFPLREITALAPDSADIAPGQMGRNVKRTELEEAIATLPPSERLLYLLRDVEGYTPAAIAKLLEMTEPQVNRGLFTARLRLRKALSEGRNDASAAA